MKFCKKRPVSCLPKRVKYPRLYVRIFNPTQAIDLVCDLFDISREQFFIKRQKGKMKVITSARFVFMVLCRRFAGYTQARTGSLMDCDHTSIVYLERNEDEWLRSKILSRKLEQAKKILGFK